MAEHNPAEDLARNIVRNIVPLNAGEDIAGPFQKAESGIMALLRQLGVLPPSTPPQRIPKLNEPLPRKNPITGEIEFPPGSVRPR